jgi:Ca2+-transporting ATPase
LLPGQILWVNLLTHGLPGVALGAEPAEPGVLCRPPRSPDEQVLGGGLWRSIAIVGSLLAAVSLGVGILAQSRGAPWQSMLFVALGLAQLGVAMAVRARRSRDHRWANPGLLAAIALSGIAQIAAVTFEPLRLLLRTEPLSLTELAICATAAAIPGIVLALVQRRRRHD